LGVVFVNAGTMSQKAVKLALPRIDHDADVAAPDHQVADLRISDSTKIIGSAVKIPRTRIWIREAGLFVDGMHQV
jgi:hypothetical protein